MYLGRKNMIVYQSKRYEKSLREIEYTNLILILFDIGNHAKLFR